MDTKWVYLTSGIFKDSFVLVGKPTLCEGQDELRSCYKQIGCSNCNREIYTISGLAFCSGRFRPLTSEELSLLSLYLLDNPLAVRIPRKLLYNEDTT